MPADSPDEVLVASFRAIEEARTALRELDRAGIFARIATDDALHIATRDLVPFLGIGILVGAGDEEAARAIIDTIFREDRAIDAPQEERCPACGSTEVVRVRRLMVFGVAALATVLLGFLTGEMRLFMLTLGVIGAALLATPNRRCGSCGERWRGRIVVVEEEAVETPEVTCPRCGSTETVRIDRRRLRAITLIVNLVVPPFFVLFPWLTQRRCESCGKEWR